VDINKLMKQAQKMQSQVADAQAALKSVTVEAAAGGGKVKVVANAHLEVQSISIDPEVVDPDDADMLEDLVLSAVQEAQRLAKAKQEEEMAKVTGGMGLPPGLM
jgi:DNA-binding YbaB/EbfC family protein